MWRKIDNLSISCPAASSACTCLPILPLQKKSKYNFSFSFIEISNLICRGCQSFSSEVSVLKERYQQLGESRVCKIHSFKKYSCWKYLLKRLRRLAAPQSGRLLIFSDFRQLRWRRYVAPPGWQKLCGGTGGPRRKVRTRTKILSLTYAILSRIKICRDLRTFWRSLGKKKCFLGQKQCFLGKKCTITWYILHISLS